MKQQTFIHIPEPCHENWDNMTAEGRGRFCASCAKIVVDFTAMTDAQVLNYLNTIKGNTCGRFKDDQLERAMQEDAKKKKNRWQWVLATLTTLSFANKLQAQISNVKVTPLVNIPESKSATSVRIRLGGIASSTEYQTKTGEFIVTGIVKGETGDVLSGTVIIINDKRSVVTNTEGAFSFKVDASKEKEIALVVSYVGYVTWRGVWKSDKIKDKLLSINMKLDVDVLGEVSVTAQKGKAISCTMRAVENDSLNGFAGAVAIVRKVTFIDTIATHTKQLLGITTVYPNPANKGSQINIKTKDAGDYAIQLLNNNGSFLSQQIQSGAVEKQTLPFTIPVNIAAGNYYLRIINNTTKKQTTEKIIVL